MGRMVIAREPLGFFYGEWESWKSLEVILSAQVCKVDYGDDCVAQRRRWFIPLDTSAKRVPWGWRHRRAPGNLIRRYAGSNPVTTLTLFGRLTGLGLLSLRCVRVPNGPEPICDMHARSLPERAHPARWVAPPPYSVVRAAQHNFFWVRLAASRNFKTHV